MKNNKREALFDNIPWIQRDGNNYNVFLATDEDNNTLIPSKDSLGIKEMARPDVRGI